MQKRRYRKWTIELILEEAKKYEYRSDFKKAEPNLYKKIINNGLASVAFSHMLHKPSVWTKEKCEEAAKECKSKSDYNNKFPGAYKSSVTHGWFTEISERYFTPVGNLAKRCIYSYEFSDNCVYVGLTCNIERRNNEHMHQQDSQVYIHKQETGIVPKLTQLTEYIDHIEASKLEGVFLKMYTDNGWSSLNKTKTGGLGTKFEPKKRKETKPQKRWTLADVALLAKKYATRRDFLKNSPYAYSWAIKHGVLDEICEHMVLLQRRKWTKEEAANEALKYKEKSEFQKNSNGCYLVASRNGWLDEICGHMVSGYDRLKKYNEEIVIETLGKYNKLQELKTSDDKFVRGCYWWLKKHKLLGDYKKFLRHE